MLEIKNLDQVEQGVFFIGEDGQRLAELQYIWADQSTLIIKRTWVDQALRGQNIGRLLLDHAIELAQKKQAKIVARCSYAQSVFENDPSIQESLAVA